MELYKDPIGEAAKVVKEHAKFMEEAKISEPAMYANSLYREVKYKKKLTGGFSYLYLDQNNNAVKDRTTIARLGRLFFFMDSYLNDAPGSIIHTIGNEEEMQKTKEEVKAAREGLELVKKKATKLDLNINDINDVDNILVKFLELRSETDDKLKVFCDKVNSEMEKSKYFDEDMIEKCMPEYKQVMLSNYDKVKYIMRKQNCFVPIKKASEKVRITNNLKFLTMHSQKLSSLQYLMRYFENLSKSYDSIIKMSVNQYLRSVEASGKVNAEYKMEQLR